jgi:mannose PTS system EIID component
VVLRIITKFDLFRIFLRSFYIQATWNNQRMINLGFCYSIMPILKKLYPKSPEKVEFLKRHLNFFNSHPYFASFALGATVRLEEQYSHESWPSERPIIVFKNRLCGPLGAIGDRLFWGTIKPLAAMIGVLVTLFFGILGPVVLFFIYNIPHIYLRYYGIMKGYSLGFDIVRELSKRKFEKYTKYLQLAGLVFVGFFIGLFFIWSGKSHGFSALIIFSVSMLISYPIIRFRKPIILPIIINILLMIGYTFFVSS